MGTLFGLRRTLRRVRSGLRTGVAGSPPPAHGVYDYTVYVNIRICLYTHTVYSTIYNTVYKRRMHTLMATIHTAYQAQTIHTHVIYHVHTYLIIKHFPVERQSRSLPPPGDQHIRGPDHEEDGVGDAQHIVLIVLTHLYTYDMVCSVYVGNITAYT